MPRGIRRFLCALTLLLAPSLTQAADIPDTSLTPLKFLVGEWKGADAEGKPHKVAYALSSGGTSLTEYGQRVIALYRAVELEYQQAIDRLAKTLGEPGAGSVRQFQTLLRRMSMRTSARNQFVGTVSGLREGEVSFEVRVRLDDAHEIVAVITRESAENLELAIGLEVHAFVKAPSVIIVTDPETRTSARNHLWGEVTRIHPGPVSSEVTITLPSGRNVTSVVTHDSIDMLALVPGVPACAVFQASAVILAVFD